MIHRTLAYPAEPRPLQLRYLATAVDRTRTLRGAVCGACAAAVWALEQPLDKLLFDGGYDDVELLGKAVVRGDGWYPAGVALHLGERGAVRRRLRQRRPRRYRCRRCSAVPRRRSPSIWRCGR